MPVHDFTRLGVVWRWLAGRGRPGPQLPGEGPVIGTSDRGAPIYWSPPTAEAAQHSFVTAGSGAGKTAMLASAIVQEVVAPVDDPARRTAYVIIDGKNDLGQAVLHGLASVAPDRLADVRWLAPFAKDGFPFNLCKLDPGITPLEVRALALAQLTSQVSQMQGEGGSGAGARQLDVWTHCYLGALDTGHPAASPLWALDALSESKHGLKRLAAITRSARAKNFLATTELSDELRASCGSRIRTALSLTDQLARLASTPDCFSPADLTAPGRITCIMLGSPPGGIEALPRLYGSLIGRVLVEHLFERPSPYNGHHVRLVFDEAQVVASVLSAYLDALLTRGRSLCLSACVITQGTTLLHQASETIIPLLMTNAPLKIVGRLAAPDAELLARNLGPRLGIDETVAGVRSRFVTGATNLKDREFILMRPGETTRFRSADVDLKGWDEAAVEHADEVAAVKAALAPAETGPRITLQEATKDLSFSDGRRGRGRAPVAVVPAAPRDGTPRDPSDPRPTPPPKPRSRWG
jgi:hypothetical protein